MTAEVAVRLSTFPIQTAFVESNAPYAAFVGGAGSGKTRAGVVKALIYAGQHPGSLGMVTAPTFPMLRDATLRTFEEVSAPGLYNMHLTEMRATFANGAEVLFRSTDEPERLRGPNLAWVYMDEAARSTDTAFKILQGRLRQSGYSPQLWLTTTPNGFNWVYREFAASKRPDYALFHCSTRDNPFLAPDFIRRLEESYHGAFALQEIGGEFVALGGQAFFDRDVLLAMAQDCTEPRQVQGGLLRVWRPPVVGARYVAGCDPCWGEHGSYAVVVVADWQTGEQVAELYGRPSLDELARAAVELGRRYNNAFLGVEANGEGIVVVNKMLELEYGPHLYHRGEGATKAGWLTTPTTRPVMLGELEEAVRMMRVRPRCTDAVAEMMSFIRADTGRPQPSEGAYGDHVMAWAILWQMRKYASFQGGNSRVAVVPRLW